VEVLHDDYAPHRQIVDIPGPRDGVNARELAIVVPVPGRIDGEVHERITGAAVPRFQIDAHGPDGADARFFVATTTRGRAGDPLAFSLRRLTPGRWMLRVQAAGYRPIERVVDVPPASSPGNASVRALRLEIERS
jgi:hypothetical protein